MEKQVQTKTGQLWADRWSALGNFFEKNIKKIVAVFAIVICGFGISIAVDSYRQNREEKLLNEYYQIEKKYLDQRSAYEKAVGEEHNNLAKQQKEAQGKNKKPMPPPLEVPASKIKAPDYSASAVELKDFALKNKKSRTGRQAAILATHLLNESGHSAEVKPLLTQISFDHKSLVDYLGENLKAQTLANDDNDKNGCIEASAIWKKLLSESEAQFLWAQAQLGVGLCAEKRGDTTEAQSYYNQVLAQAKDSASARAAEKYLRHVGMTSTTGDKPETATP